MTAVSVRLARPDDYPEIGRLTLVAYLADGQVRPGQPYYPVLADVAARATWGEIFVAQGDDSQLLGAVLFVLAGSEYAELAGPGEAEFRMLAVDPSAQGRGIGEALARACLARAAELGCRAVVISARDFATRAHRLYAKLGFVRMPEHDWTPLPGVNLLALRCEIGDR